MSRSERHRCFKESAGKCDTGDCRRRCEEIVVQPQDQVVREGTPVTFDAVFSADPRPFHRLVGIPIRIEEVESRSGS